MSSSSWLLAGLWLLAAPANAQVLPLLHAGSSGPGVYVGPADLPGLSSPTAFYGLRGVSAAYATPGTGKAVNVRRASDNTTQDIVILPNGNLDVATAASFAGTAATCSGTISGTTAALTGCSATPAANQPVSGAGVTQPAYVVSCGAFVAGAGSCTLNASQSVAVAETLTFQVALFVTTWYDQSGNGINANQATAGQQPQLLTLCNNGLSCMRFAPFNELQATPIGTIAQPYTVSEVKERISNFTTQGVTFLNNATVTAFNNVANQVSISANTAFAPTASALDSSPHSVQNIFNGASSVINVDGAASATGNPGNGALTTTQYIGPATGGIDVLLTESITFSLGLSSGNQTALCHNQTYWGAFGC